MTFEIKVPEVGESITEVEIGGWLKALGQRIEKDEPLVTIESAKATVDLPAPVAGTITQVLKQKGETAKVGEVIAVLEKDGQPAPIKEATSKALENQPAAKLASAPEPMPKQTAAKAQPEKVAAQLKAAAERPPSEPATPADSALDDSTS